MPEYLTPSAWLDYMEDKIFLTGQLGAVEVDVKDEDGHETGQYRWEDASGCEVDPEARCCLGHYVDASGLEGVDYSVGMLQAEIHVPLGHWLVQPATEEMVRWVQARMPYVWQPFSTNGAYCTLHDLPQLQDLFAQMNDRVWSGLDRGPIRRRLLRGFIRTFLVPRLG